MMRWVAIAVLVGTAAGQTPRPKFDSFEVATVKVADESFPGHFMRMENDHKFVEKKYSLKGLIAAAYDLNPKTISGEPGWANSDHFDIEAVSPGAVRPTHDEQMVMLRALLQERFGLSFHREKKEYSIYAVEVVKGGPKLTPRASADVPPTVGPGVVYPQKIVLPGRNATVGELASLLQRAILDRPVVDETGLTGRYDFDLEWAPDESQFGGDVPKASETAPALPLFAAIQQQMGLRLDPKRGMVDELVVDAVKKPSDN
jgi:uncharacterized protein (TIGR03435 family)